MPVITASGLTKRFRTGRGKAVRAVEAVSGISFSVERGERLAYIGPNGKPSFGQTSEICATWGRVQS